MGKTSRAVVRGSRLFNTIFGLPRNGKNAARSLGTFQSGSPPGDGLRNNDMFQPPADPFFWRIA
jgi:hypothetical protein